MWNVLCEPFDVFYVTIRNLLAKNIFFMSNENIMSNEYSRKKLLCVVLLPSLMNFNQSRNRSGKETS